jgi:hypothetical protein
MSFLSGLRLSVQRPRPTDPEYRWWPLNAVKYGAQFVWYRGPWGWAQERYWRAMWWLHRGDAESEWWCPARNEVVTTCAGKRAVVFGWEYHGRAALVRYDDGSVDRASWTACLSPGHQE